MKRTISIVLCLCLMLCCIGCKEDETSQNNTNPIDNITIDPNTNNTEPNQLISEEKIDKYLWQKDLVQFKISTIKLDSNWDKQITIGSSIIGTNAATDISKTDNFYCTDSSLCGDLEAAYYVQKKSVPISTTFGALDEDSCLYGQFTTLGATHGTNVMIEGVRFSGVPDIYVNNGLSHIRDTAPYKENNEFGIGSTMAHVKSILGEPQNSFDVSMGDGQNTTTNVYISDFVELTLVFTWMDDDMVEQGVLTSIEWVPTQIRKELHQNITPNAGIYEEQPTVEATISNETID